MFPLFLNLIDRLALVVGGGPVGRRKAASLLKAGATVRLVCLEPRPHEETSTALDWRQEKYHSEHLDGAALVFAAATPEVNRQVVVDARDLGLWINSATDPEQGDFFVPATVRRGDLVVAIGTRGSAPALAQEVRRHLDSYLDLELGVWAALLAEIRPLVYAHVFDPAQRQVLWEKLCQWQWLDRLHHEGPEAVRTAMLAEVQTLASSTNNLL